MSERPDEGVGSVLRQALVSGAIVGVILLTIVAAILLTYVIGDSDGGPTPTIIAEISTATPTEESAADTAVPVASATSTQPQATATFTPTEKPPTATRTSSPTTPAVTLTATTTPTTATETDASCQPPAGWQAYVVQTDETLATLAETYGVTPEELVEGNCLTSTALLPGQNIYVPIAKETTSPTAAITPCVPPVGWARYTVRPGDTLGALAAYCGTTVDVVMQANCMQSTTIFVGTNLYLPCVPAVPTQMPWPTLPAWTPAPWPTATPWSPMPTATSSVPQLPPTSTATPPSWVAPTAAPTQPPYVPPTQAPYVPPTQPSSGPSIPPLSTPTPGA